MQLGSYIDELIVLSYPILFFGIILLSHYYSSQAYIPDENQTQPNVPANVLALDSALVGLENG